MAVRRTEKPLKNYGLFRIAGAKIMKRGNGRGRKTKKEALATFMWNQTI